MPGSIFIYMLKLYRLLPLIGSIFLISCAWPKKAIHEAEAFYITTNPGIVAVDEKGNERTPVQTTVVVIYVQAKTTELAWDTAWFNDVAYPVKSRTQLQQAFEAGYNKNGEKITIQPKPGFYLFQLQVEPLITPETELPGSILLRSIYRGKTMVKKIFPILTIIPFEAV